MWYVSSLHDRYSWFWTDRMLINAYFLYVCLFVRSRVDLLPQQRLEIAGQACQPQLLTAQVRWITRGARVRRSSAGRFSATLRQIFRQ